jgi:hypothetical protein
MNVPSSLNTRFTLNESPPLETLYFHVPMRSSLSIGVLGSGGDQCGHPLVVTITTINIKNLVRQSFIFLPNVSLRILLIWRDIQLRWIRARLTNILEAIVGQIQLRGSIFSRLSWRLARVQSESNSC